MNDNDDLSILSDNVDKSQVPPIEQKRMVAFINDFIVSTVSFLNQFMAQCDTKFLEFEQKMQKIEASLVIVEAKMASIPDVDLKPSPSPSNDKTDNQDEILEKPQILNTTEIAQDIPLNSQTTETDVTQVECSPDEQDNSNGVKACDDTRYRKYFKMLQFGVPAPAVKLKMANEGFDSNVLDEPNRILEDGVAFVASDD